MLLYNSATNDFIVKLNKGEIKGAIRAVAFADDVVVVCEKGCVLDVIR